MTAAEKAAAADARVAEARRVTAASLTGEELAALLKTKQDAAAAAAAKVAAEAAAAKAATEAAAAAATAATGATADAGTTETPATGDAGASEDRIVEKPILRFKASGMFPTSPVKPAAEGGVTPRQAAIPEVVAVLKLYKGAQAQEAPTTPNASLLAQATRDLATADQEAVAAAEKQRTAQQLLTKISALPPTSYGGQVDLAGPERTAGSASGASRSSLHGLGGGLSGGGDAGPFGTSSSGSHGRGGGL